MEDATQQAEVEDATQQAEAEAGVAALTAALRAALTPERRAACAALAQVCACIVGLVFGHTWAIVLLCRSWLVKMAWPQAARC